MRTAAEDFGTPCWSISELTYTAFPTNGMQLTPADSNGFALDCSASSVMPAP
jgi:hypothetical protein